MAAPAPQPPAAPEPSAQDLLCGWDMAYLAPLRGVNAALRAQGFVPRDIDVPATDSLPRSLKATLVDFALAVDSLAVGGNVVLRLGLAGIEFCSRTAAVPETWAVRLLTDLSCTGDAQLEWVRGPPSGTDVLTLGAITGASVVRLRSPQVTADPDFDQIALISEIQELLAGWLDAQLPALSLAFARALPALGQSVASEPYGWCLPRALAYAVAQPVDQPDEDNCVFALLGVVEPERLAALVPQAPLLKLAKGADSAYVLSSSLFARSIAWPAVLAGLGVKSHPRCVPTEDRTALVNADAIDLPDLDLSGVSGVPGSTGSNARIEPGNLTIRIQGSRLLLNLFQMSFDSTDETFLLSLQANFGLGVAAKDQVTLQSSGGTTAQVSIGLTDAAERYQTYSTLAFAALSALLALVPGGEAGAEMKVALEGGEVVARGAEKAAELSAEEAAAVAAQAGAELAGAAPRLSGFAGVLAQKVGISLGVAVAQQIVCNAPSLLRLIQVGLGAEKQANWKPFLDGVSLHVGKVACFGNEGLGKGHRWVDARLDDGVVLMLAAGAPARPEVAR